MAEKNWTEQDKSYFQRFCDYMQRDTKGVEITTYTISGILLAVAYNKIRPITRFGKPTDIPKHFIREQLPQRGQVRKIEPSIQSGPLLIVKHKPPLNIFFWSGKTLPVKVAGIDVNANGYSWLQSIVVNRKVTFVPMKYDASKNYAECSVYFDDRSTDGKYIRRVDVAQALLSLGFAKVNVAVPLKQITTKDQYEKQMQAYYKLLSRSESLARDRRVGVWQQVLPPKHLLAKMWQNQWDKVVLRLSPQSHRLPPLVR